VGIDTIFKSGGTIPESFLRGCGVPEQFITYARSLVGQPIEFYSCFISHSSHDQAFVERLHADLCAKDLRCWYAPEDLRIGDRFQEQIEESIRHYDKVMIVLSVASVESCWVEREDRDNRTVLFPIRIDDAVMNTPRPWAADVRRSRNIGDFRGCRRRSASHANHSRRLEWSAPRGRGIPCGRVFRPEIAGMLLCREGHPGKSVGQRPSPDTGPSKRSLAAAHLRHNEPRNGETRDPAGSSSTGRRRSGPDSRTIVARPKTGLRDRSPFKSRQAKCPCNYQQ
jgi:hypothetical protein